MGNVRIQDDFNSLLANNATTGTNPTRGGSTTQITAPTTNPANQLSTNAPTIASNLAQAQLQEQARLMAEEMLRQRALQAQTAGSGRVFTKFQLVEDIVENQKTLVTSGLFSNNTGALTQVFTSSLQSTSSKTYFYEVQNTTGSSAEGQFAIAYGHRLGSGSSALGTLNDSPTKAIYSQYKQLLLNPGDTTFTLSDSTATDSIYVVNFNRARVKDKLDPGNWEITLGNLSGSSLPNNVHTGSNVRFSGSVFMSFIDDSSDTQQAANIVGGGRAYNIVSGSITGGVSSTTPYGIAYPDMGILVFDANKLNTALGFNTVTGSNVAGDNAFKFFTSLSGSIASSPTTRAFQARNEETITSTHYFVRIKNGEYNFSNNPTFTTGSLGEFSQPTFINDPKVYITTIGMYNDRQELLAIAKLNKPLKKSFSNEALIEVKLDF